jgi:phosphonate transport system substrate-binding protein
MSKNTFRERLNNMRNFIKFISISILFLLPVFSASGQIKIGILPRLSATELNKMFNPLCEYLSKELGEKVVLVVPKDFDTFVQMVNNGDFDYAFSNPNVYVEAKTSLGKAVEPLAIAVEKGTGKTFTGCFLVKKGSSIKKISDFKNKKMIFVDSKSAGGYLSQVYTMQQNSVSTKDVTVLPFAKKHTNVALAVQNGVADIGGIRTADFDKIKTQVNIPDVQILMESAAIPNWPLFTLQNSKKDISNKIKEALIKLKPKSSLASSTVDSAGLDGFVPCSDSDFDSMRKISETTKGL